MASGRLKRWGIVGLVILVLVGIGAAVGFRLAVQAIKAKVVEALGPDSEIAELRVGWGAVEVQGLRIKGQAGWPAADALRAERVIVVPSLRSLLSDQIQVGSVTVVRPYLSALRTRDGRLRVVPSLLEAQRPAAAGTPPPAAARTAAISRITLQDGVVELFDATVASPPLKIRLEQVQATLRDLVVPTLRGKSRLEMAGVVKGVQGDGRVNVTGWIEPATKDSSINTEIRSVDLVAFQPYLARAGETRVRKGWVDLDLQSEVRQNRLRAPGRVTISDLEFPPAQGPLDTFMGVPRAAVVNFLKSKDNKIQVSFILEGDINNPRFTLNEAVATRIASSVAESLGVSIRGVSQGVGGLGLRGGEAVGEAAKSVGGALRGLFGGEKKR